MPIPNARKSGLPILISENIFDNEKDIYKYLIDSGIIEKDVVIDLEIAGTQSSNNFEYDLLKINPKYENYIKPFHFTS